MYNYFLCCKFLLIANRNISITTVKIAYVLLLTFALLYTFFFEGGKEGFIEGWNSANIANTTHFIDNIEFKEPLKKNNIPFYDSLKFTKSYQQVIIYGRGKPAGINWLTVIEILSIMLFTFIAITIFITLYAFINAIAKNKVFEIENIKRLSNMGWKCISLGPISFLAYYISDKRDQLLVSPLSFNIKFSFNFEFWLIVMGVTLLTIAFAFKRGLEMKEENDLTV